MVCVVIWLALLLGAQSQAQEQPETPLRTWTSKNLEKGKYRVYGDDGSLVLLRDASPKGGNWSVRPNDLSNEDLDYLEGFSILPPTQDPKTADFQTIGDFDWLGHRNRFNPLLPFGIKRSLESYQKMSALRLKKLHIDVLSLEEERESRWAEVGIQPGYFPKEAANEFEENRHRKQFLQEVQALEPFRFAKEVYIAPLVRRDKYDFERGGYAFELPQLLLARGDQVLSRMAFLPVPPEEAEAFPKGISRRCLITLRPIGISKGEIGFSFVFEPVKAKTYHESPMGIWKETNSEPVLEDMFTPVEGKTVEVNTNFNEAFIAK